MKRIFSYFFQGLIYIAPIGITIYVIYFLFTIIDGFIRGYMQKIFDIDIPGLGIVILFGLITLLGLIGSTIIARPIKSNLFSNQGSSFGICREREKI